MSIVPTRDIPSAIQSTIDAGGTIGQLNMVFLDFANNPMRIHTGIGSKRYDGHDWLPLASALTISQAVEERDGKTSNLRMTLRVFDSDILAAARGLTYQDRTVQVLKGWLNVVEATIVGATEYRYGVMVDMAFVEDEDRNERAIIVTMQDEISLLDNEKGWHWDQTTLKNRLGESNTTMFQHTQILRTLSDQFRLGPVRPAGNPYGGDTTYDNYDFRLPYIPGQ